MAVDHPTTDHVQGLLSWARDELRRRLDAGVPCRAEQFLSEFPALASDPDRAIELVVSEYEIRRARGETVDPSEWYSRFPQWHDRLHNHFASPQGLAESGGGGLTVPEPSHARAAPVFQLAAIELIQEIGRGGMGVVFEAHDPELNRRVALKMIRDRCSDGTAIDRFRREARVLARLRHPNIVEVFAVGQFDGAPCYTMPLLGSSLSQKLAQGPMSQQEAVALMEKVARAIQAAHEADVVHRDLKPANILLDENGEPKVADFGLAKLLDDHEASLTAGQIGTPSYMSPEQAAGQPAHKPSDVWALGVILYELLTHRRPFEGRGEALKECIRAADPPAPRTVQPELSLDLEAVLLRCLEKDPVRRYASAAALADDLGCWLRGEPVQARRPSRMRRGCRVLARWWARPVVRVAAVAVLMVATAAGVWLSVRPAPRTQSAAVVAEDPERSRREALEQIYRELDGGAAATLLDKRGRERWYRWATEKDRPPLDPPLFSYRNIKAVDLVCQCELLPESRMDAYRFSADVQLGQRLPLGRAGVYFQAEEIPTPDGRLYRYLTLHAAAQKAGKEAVLRFGLEHFREPKPTRAGPPDRSYIAFKVYPPAWLERWHTIQAEVSDQGLTLRCDGAVLKDFPQAQVDTKVQAFERQLRTGALPPLKRRGSLGLFVSDCSANFRNVVVKPLPAK